jgi:hypothetical protein
MRNTTTSPETVELAELLGALLEFIVVHTDRTIPRPSRVDEARSTPMTRPSCQSLDARSCIPNDIVDVTSMSTERRVGVTAREPAIADTGRLLTALTGK